MFPWFPRFLSEFSSLHLLSLFLSLSFCRLKSISLPLYPTPHSHLTPNEIDRTNKQPTQTTSPRAGRKLAGFDDDDDENPRGSPNGEVDLDTDAGEEEGEGKATKKQLTIGELFDVIDTNGDGSLDLEEVRRRQSQ